MSTKKRITYIFWLIITIIPILGLIWSIASPQDFRNWQTVSRNWNSNFGIFGPVVFIIVQALQVVITPISHYTVGAIGGYLYGPYWGGAFNYVGRIIGHYCAFTIARHYGRPYIVRHLDPKTVMRYDKIFGQAGEASGLQPFILFLVYFLPFFPDDEISYLVGMSSMSRRSFVLANLFGHLGGAFSLAYIGSGINTNDVVFWILTISTLLGFPVIWGALYVHARRRERAKKRVQ
jgi:uncharacterized membrane protein YdjX (TVP38/TMEM64 family)